MEHEQIFNHASESDITEDSCPDSDEGFEVKRPRIYWRPEDIKRAKIFFQNKKVCNKEISLFFEQFPDTHEYVNQTLQHVPRAGRTSAFSKYIRNWVH